jgi:FkbM family methyltransferase
LFHDVIAKNSYGKFYCRKNEEDLSIISDGHEPKTLSLFLKLAKRSKIVIDVGAHIGKYTVLASRILKNKGKVISIEPSKENFEILKMNISLNKLENVVALNLAASNLNKRNVKLYKTLRESGRKTLKYIPNTPYELVNCINLDYLLKRLKVPKVDLIKIEVEGEELNVIKGFKRYLSSHKVDNLIIEINYENLNRMRNILNSLGYSLQKIEATNYIVKHIQKKKL